MQGNFLQGARFFWFGAKRMGEPGLRRYVAFPLLLNTSIVITFTWWLSDFIAQVLPDWLLWLYWMLLPLAIISIVLTLAYFFSAVLLILSSPLNGFLSEKVERKSGTLFKDEPVVQLLKRVLKREFIKLRYFLPRYLILLIFTFIPVINFIMPLVWFLFGSWVIALLYTDYSFDNHQRSFSETRSALSKKLITVFGFGAVVSLLMTIPIVNWFVMPAAVIGATMMREACFAFTPSTSKTL